MGCNYYHRTNICPLCERYDERHIGKSSGGWQFNFQGYRDLSEETQIASYQDWLRELGKGGEIVDEYGGQLTLVEFRERVENRGEQNWRNHTLYCQEHFPEHARLYCWLDLEGYSFTGCDFS